MACFIRFISIRYVGMEHIRHCVPSNVSSGLGNLPLKYVWVDSKENKSWPTDPYLPTGEPLNGKQAYSKIMSYFTTNAMTPAEVHELGKKQLSILYPMVSLRTSRFFLNLCPDHLESGSASSCICKCTILNLCEAKTKRFDMIRYELLER